MDHNLYDLETPAQRKVRLRNRRHKILMVLITVIFFAVVILALRLQRKAEGVPDPDNEPKSLPAEQFKGPRRGT